MLKMFREEEAADAGSSPQYSVQLRGAQVQPGPDTASSYRISLLQHGDQVAVLEVRGEKRRSHAGGSHGVV